MPTLMETPKGPVTVRAAEVRDAAGLRELRLEALADSPVAFAADYDRTAGEPETRWVERITESTREESGVICVAEADNRLVGLTGLGRGHWPKTQHSAVIWGVYVTPDYRGLHIAEGLIEECIAWGRAHGVSIVKLGVITTNAPAIRCYLRCGFTVYGVDPQSNYYAGEFYDELLMSRLV